MATIESLVQDILPAAEEDVLQFASQILADKTLQAPQRIQISNLLVSSAADLRNAITRLQQAIPLYNQLKQSKPQEK